MSQQNALAETVAEAVVSVYPDLVPQAPPDPIAVDVQALQSLIALSIVHVLPVVEDGLAAVGFEFACAWSESEGLGVLTHGQRVIRIGPAGAAYLPLGIAALAPGNSGRD